MAMHALGRCTWHGQGTQLHSQQVCTSWLACCSCCWQVVEEGQVGLLSQNKTTVQATDCWYSAVPRLVVTNIERVHVLVGVICMPSCHVGHRMGRRSCAAFAAGIGWRGYYADINAGMRHQKWQCLALWGSTGG